MIIWTIAKTTFGEAMRKKILNVFLIVAVGMIVISMGFTNLDFQSDLTTVKALGMFVILLAGFIISLIMCVSLIPNEVERRTIYTILSKPVNRYEFVIGKFVGGLLTLFVNIALMGAVFVLMVTLKVALSHDVSTLSKVGEMAQGAGGALASKPKVFDPSLLLGVLMIYLQFLVFSAVVMLFSVFLTPTVNFFASSAVYVVGSASAIWQSIAANKGEHVAVVAKAFYWVMSHVFPPNFDLYNIQNRLIHPHHEVRSMGAYVAFVIGYSVLYSVLLMIVAALIFDRKEV